MRFPVRHRGRTSCRIAAAGLLLALAGPSEAADTAFHAAGYGSVGADIPLDGEPAYATAVSFNPIFLWREGDRMLIETELAFAYGSEGLVADLEYATIDFDVGGPIVGAGKFLTPTGQFISRLHPAWINKLPDFPLPYRLGVVPMSHIGVFGQYALHIGPQQKLAAVAWIDNGPGGDAASPDLSAKVGDDNWDKGLGARIGFFALPQLEFGVSGYTGAYGDDAQFRYSLAIGDVAWTMGGFLDVRGEFIYAAWSGGGFMGAWSTVGWRIRQVDALSWLEPVVRFGYGDGKTDSAPGDAGGAERIPVSAGHGSGDIELTDEPIYELCFGANAWVRNNVVVKLAYVHHVEEWNPTLRASVGFGY